MLPHGRKDLTDPRVKERLIKSALDFKHIFFNIKEISGHLNSDIPINEFKNTEWLDGFELTYRNGELYFVPALNEGVTTFNKDFLYTGKFNAESLLLEKEIRILKQISQSKNKECHYCQFQNVCANREVLSLLDTIGYTQCITALKDFPNEFYWT